MYLEPVSSQPALSPAQLANLSGLAAQDAITNAINSAAVQVAKENNISVPQASLIVQSEVNQSFQQPNYVPNIPASLVPSLDAYKASLNAENLAQKAVANQAASTTGITTPSTDTLANLGGAGTTKPLDTGTIVDKNKLNTQGGGSALGTSDAGALGTSDINKIPTTGGSALGTSDINKIPTSPAATSSPNTMNTGSIPALTTADLAAWGKTLPQGLTSDQLTAALKTQQDVLNKSYTDALAGNQTALTSQNANFLKDWNTSADALKNSILSGVDTKNQAFGTQATQGFMDAFKNFQIPTNQQTGVNLGNYNDNRNAAADQWWSQYVTGRR